MQLPSPKKRKKKQTFPAHLLKFNGKTKLIDGGKWKEPGNIKEELVTIMALIGCYHSTGQPISSFSHLLRQVTNENKI